MGISDKEAFRILGLPLGVDKDAINERYKSLSCKLSASKAPADKKRLEEVVAAFSQLLPQPIQRNNHARHKTNSAKMLCRNGRGAGQHSQQQLSEAERERRKAEKRRAKKKRRKEKKKIEKIENRIFNQNSDDTKKKEESGSDDEDDDDDEDEDDDDDDEEEEGQGLDPTSAFVATAVKSRRRGMAAAAAAATRQEKPTGKQSKQEDRKTEDTNGVDGTVLQARQLAMRGNEAANVGQYSAAVRLFTDAIRLHPLDHRFFGNRSYCHHQLSHHDKALKDAERAIKLSPQWPKGHFRRGTSLRGLGKFLEAESAFEEVLRLDPGCQEAHEEIKQVRVTRIVEMGFTGRQAASAISKYTHVQPALDALLAGEFREGLGDVFYSDEEDIGDDDDALKRVGLTHHAIPSAASTNANLKMNPKNPEGLMSLWVGNVLPEVTEKMLTQLFAKQGHVTSVRLLKEKYCAFVNYQDKAAAGRAMEHLQGHELCGQRLLIKFPDNPITTSLHTATTRKTKAVQNGMKNSNPVSKSNGPTNSVASSNTSSGANSAASLTQQPQTNGAKLKGPVNGDECYFWRTTGCAFGDACKHKHIPRNKGIDRKPWQK